MFRGDAELTVVATDCISCSDLITHEKEGQDASFDFVSFSNRVGGAQ